MTESRKEERQTGFIERLSSQEKRDFLAKLNQAIPGAANPKKTKVNLSVGDLMDYIFNNQYSELSNSIFFGIYNSESEINLKIYFYNFF